MMDILEDKFKHTHKTHIIWSHLSEIKWQGKLIYGY